MCTFACCALGVCTCLPFHLLLCLLLSTSACARASRLAAACAGASACVWPVASSSVEFAAVAHARSTPMHGAHTSCSDTGRVKGPTCTRRVKGGVSGPAEDLRLVSEVEAGVNFRPAGGVRGQVAGPLPRRQSCTGTITGKGRCVHTFPPPGGSWYPIRVTLSRIVHQAINGLDEGAWNCTVEDLGARGYRQDLYVPCQS